MKIAVLYTAVLSGYLIGQVAVQECLFSYYRLIVRIMPFVCVRHVKHGKRFIFPEYNFWFKYKKKKKPDKEKEQGTEISLVV